MISGFFFVIIEKTGTLITSAAKSLQVEIDSINDKFVSC